MAAHSSGRRLCADLAPCARAGPALFPPSPAERRGSRGDAVVIYGPQNHSGGKAMKPIRRQLLQAAGAAVAALGVNASSGRYTVEGEKVVHHVDVSWNESWTGTDQVRFFKLEGDRLTITTAPQK